ncbi:10317_t:CDS:2, partial [Acaulospora colombiana]
SRISGEMPRAIFKATMLDLGQEPYPKGVGLHYKTVGGKRPYHTIIPALVTRGEELFITYGVMGGFMQPQGHVQVLLNLLRGWNPLDALDAPRFCISPGLPDAPVKEAQDAGNINSEVYFEPGITDAVVQTLRGMGHDARQVTGPQRGMMGRGQIIQKLKTADGSLVAGSQLMDELRLLQQPPSKDEAELKTLNLLNSRLPTWDALLKLPDFADWVELSERESSKLQSELAKSTEKVTQERASCIEQIRETVTTAQDAALLRHILSDDITALSEEIVSSYEHGITQPTLLEGFEDLHRKLNELEHVRQYVKVVQQGLKL